MEAKYKITIPKPCHEDWNTMTPNETGKFCGSCVKSVIDFTNMKASEIQEYFDVNQGKRICGRFKNEQVNTFDLEIPQSILRKKMSFHKAFVLALFIVMGSTLFSCKNQNNATLGEVSVVNDSIVQDSVITENILTGEVDSDSYDSLNPPPKPKIDEVKFIKKSSEQMTTLGIAMPEKSTNTTENEKK